MRNKRAKDIRKDLKQKKIDITTSAGKKAYRTIKKAYREGQL